MENPITSENTEFNDNRISLYVGQAGKCGVTGKTLEKGTSHLHKIVNKFYETVEKFIDWICQKFGLGESKELIEKFEEETHSSIDPKKKIEYEIEQKYEELDI